MICDGSSCLKLGFDRFRFSGKRNEIIVTQYGLEPILPIRHQAEPSGHTVFEFHGAGRLSAILAFCVFCPSRLPTPRTYSSTCFTLSYFVSMRPCFVFSHILLEDWRFQPPVPDSYILVSGWWRQINDFHGTTIPNRNNFPKESNQLRMVS